MGRNFAVSDLHGVKKLYDKIKDFLQPDDKVYCLGDCGDRGPQPWETLVAVHDDLQFEYLAGNHEVMLADAIDNYIQGHIGRKYNLLRQNGGEDTFNGWKEIYKQDKHLGWSWLMNLRALNTHIEYCRPDGKIIYLSHAGFNPPIEDKDDEDLIWDRTHYIHEHWDWDPNIYIVHGHTPWYFIEVERSDKRDRNIFEAQAYFYCDNHKICIDNASFATNMTVLLDLDTFEVIPFNVSGEE